MPEPVPVWRSPLAWVRNDCRGLVLLTRERSEQYRALTVCDAIVAEDERLTADFEKCSIIRGWRLQFTHTVVVGCAMPRDAFQTTALGGAAHEAAEPSRKLVALNVVEFLSREIPSREMLLAPILPTQGLVMLYSWRGVGKTHTAIGIALAVASGGALLALEGACRKARALPRW